MEMNYSNFIGILLMALLHTVQVSHQKRDPFASSVFIFFDEESEKGKNSQYSALSYWCSGIIITPQWILTIATCFKDSTPNPVHYIVTPSKGAQSYSKSSTLKHYRISKIYHEVKEQIGANLVLVRLQENITFSDRVYKANLPSLHVTESMSCNILYWTPEVEKNTNQMAFKAEMLTGNVSLIEHCENKDNYYDFCFHFALTGIKCYVIQGCMLLCNNYVQGIVISNPGGSNPRCFNIEPNVVLVDLGIYSKWLISHINSVEAAISCSNKKKYSKPIPKGTSKSDSGIHTSFLLSFIYFFINFIRLILFIF